MKILSLVITIVIIGRWEELKVAKSWNDQSYNSSGKHVLPMVPIVIHSRNAHERCAEQWEKDEA